MRLPSEGIGKVCPGLRRQLADHGFGEGTATHVAQGRTIDNVVGVSGAQEIEEVFNRLLLARVPNHLKRGGQSAPIGNAASRNHRDRGDGIDHSRHKSHRARVAPEWPPASRPCAMMISASAAAASLAWASVCTWQMILQPASFARLRSGRYRHSSRVREQCSRHLVAPRSVSPCLRYRHLLPTIKLRQRKLSAPLPTTIRRRSTPRM